MGGCLFFRFWGGGGGGGVCVHVSAYVLVRAYVRVCVRECVCA